MNLTQTFTWIPVTERLPRVHQVCIILLKNGDAMHAAFRDCHFSTIPGAYQTAISRVSHWAEPLLHPDEIPRCEFCGNSPEAHIGMEQWCKAIFDQPGEMVTAYSLATTHK